MRRRQQTCHQLYLPRLKDDSAFHNTLSAGAESQDFFGFAQGKEGDCYLGFSFGKRTPLFLDASLLIIETMTAAKYAELQRIAEDAARATIEYPILGTGAAQQGLEDSAKPNYTLVEKVVSSPAKKQFYGSIELNAIQAKKQFADIVDEIVLQFTSRPGVKVNITIEIQAESTIGFDDSLQRVVKENSNVLRFKNAEFE